MLYITTPCSRPENLEIISKTIPKECYWAVIYDNKINIPKIENANYFKCEDTGFVGAKGRNYFIDNYPLKDEDWIYSLDDDNIIHPEWYKNIKDLLELDCSIIHWGQLNPDCSIRLIPNIEINHIDAACFITKWKFNKNTKYNTEKYEYDGIYAIECKNNGPYLTVNKYISYYNYLKGQS
jgi:hypothetical protein